MDEIDSYLWERPTYGGRGMDEQPDHPHGIGMYGSFRPGPHLGRRVRFAALPERARALVLRDTGEG